MIQEHHNLNSLELSYNNLSFDEIGNHSTWSSFNKVSTLKLTICKLKSISLSKEPTQSISFRPFRQPNRRDGTKLDLRNCEWIFSASGSFSQLPSGNTKPVSLPRSLNMLDLYSNQLHGKIPVPPPFTSYIFRFL